MKRLSRLISVFLAVIFCFSAFNLNVLAAPTMADTCKDCPKLSLDTPCPVEYDSTSSDADEGCVTFTPTKTGDYYFYSLGEFDTMATLYNGTTGKEVAKNDDCFATNFVIQAHLEAGVTYVLKTKNGSYCHQSKINFTVGISSSSLIKLLSDEINNVNLTGQTIEVSFVIDSTGSMDEEINSVKEQLKNFVSNINDTHATLHVNLIDYQDITHDGMNSTRIHKSSKGNVWYGYSDVDELKKEISNINLGDGGDRAETPIDALGYLVSGDTIKYEDASTKFAFLITDADYKTDNRHGIANMSDLAAKLKAKGVKTSVITAKDYFDDYETLANETNGELYNINENFEEALDILATEVITETAESTSSPSFLSILKILFGLDLKLPVGKIQPYLVVTQPFNVVLSYFKFEVEDTSVANIEFNASENKLVIEGKKEGSTKVNIETKDGAHLAAINLAVSSSVNYGSTIESCAIGTLISKMQTAADYVNNFVLYNEANAFFTMSYAQQTSVFSKIKDTDKCFTIVNDDEEGKPESTWTFCGTDLTSTTAGGLIFNPNVNINNSTSPAKAVAAAKFDKFTTFDFLHTGTLPGEATITAAVKNYADGIYELYYYNPVSRSLESEGTATVKDDCAEFPISHCSSYVLGNKHNHSYKAVVTKPTSTALGYTTHTCSCGHKYVDTYTAPTSKMTLKHAGRNATAVKVTWNNVKTATGYQVQISTKDGKKWSTYATLKAGVNTYTFKKLAAGNAYKFRVRFYIAKNGKNYYSPWSKTLTSPTSPNGTSLTKVTPAKKAFTAQWKKNATVTGYQVQYSLKSNLSGAKTITVKNAKILKAVAKKLNAGKNYYVRIRTYKTISKVNYFSTWSKVVKVKTK